MGICVQTDYSMSGTQRNDLHIKKNENTKETMEERIRERIDYYRKIINSRSIYRDAFQKQKENSLYNTAMIPVMIEFVTWVIGQAQQQSIKRLYFLSRDGYQMFLVAKDLCRKMNIDIEIRYLNVSRFSMRVPEYAMMGEKCLDRIFIGGIDVTFRRIMKRAALTDEEIHDVAKEYDMDNELDRMLNYQEIMILKSKFVDNRKLLAYVQKHSKKAYPNAIGYLSQEGLLDDIKYGLVDSGWVGTLQQTIRHLTQKDRIDGFYFGLYETPKDEDSDMYHGFYFNPKTGLDRKSYFSNCLFEAVFTSPEGMTIGYSKEADRYIPQMDMEQNPNKEIIQDNIRRLLNYLNQINIYDKQSDVQFVEKLLKPLMAHPTKTEVEEFGNLLFSDDVLEGNLKKVAAELSYEEIANQRFIPKMLIMLGISKKEIHESAWIEGSIVRLGESVDRSLRSAERYKKFVYIRKRIQMRMR